MIQPRSVVLNLFNEYIRHRGGEASVGRLLALLEPFEISETALRATLSRMSREGWLSGRRTGRQSIYSLTPKSWRMLDEAQGRQARHDAEQDRPWTGEWFMLVYAIGEERKLVRDALRRELTWLGFGSLAPATWISPRNRFGELQELKRLFGLQQDVQALQARTFGLEEDQALARRAWPLDKIAATYRDLAARYRPLAECLREQGAPSPAESYVQRMVMTHDSRKLPYIDPQLPKVLLPEDWPAYEARVILAECTAALTPPAFAFADAVLDIRSTAALRVPLAALDSHVVGRPLAEPPAHGLPGPRGRRTMSG